MSDAIFVALIAALPASLTGAALIITSLRTNRKVDAIEKEVATLNESTQDQRQDAAQGGT